jgi:hypothetical protein
MHTKRTGIGVTHRWRCRCDCGKLIEVYGRELSMRQVISCGCVPNPAKPKSKGTSNKNGWWTDERRKVIPAYHALGMSSRDIAAIVGVSAESVSNVARRMGIKLVSAKKKDRVKLQDPAECMRGVRFDDIRNPNIDKLGAKPQRQHDRSLTGNSSEMVMSG